MVTVYFYIQDVVMAQWEPSGQTVNLDYYTEILTTSHEKMRRKQPGF